MMMKTILLILSFVLYANAVPNSCCKNNGPLKNFKCADNSTLWVQHVCKFEAYMITKEEYQINNDTLIMIPDGETVLKNEYCIGKMDDEYLAMICFEDPEIQTSYSGISSVGIIVCCTISIISLILTLAVYIILPNLRDLQGKCMMITIFCLMMAFIFLAIVQNTFFTNENTCFILALLVYFSFISTFVWLNIVAINVWQSVVRPKLFSSKKNLFTVYNIYGWGTPIILLIILLICHHSDGDHIKPNMGETRCWFGNSKGLRLYFYGPIIALLILNIIMFISTAWKLGKQAKNATEKKYKSHKYKMCLYLKLFILMGICWIFEPLSELLRKEGRYIWLVTDYINGLQGLIIFFLLVVNRKRVRRDLAKKGGFCFRGLPKEWASIPDEECEELEEDVDELSIENDKPVVATTLHV